MIAGSDTGRKLRNLQRLQFRMECVERARERVDSFAHAAQIPSTSHLLKMKRGIDRRLRAEVSDRSLQPMGSALHSLGVSARGCGTKLGQNVRIVFHEKRGDLLEQLRVSPHA